MKGCFFPKKIDSSSFRKIFFLQVDKCKKNDIRDKTRRPDVMMMIVSSPPVSRLCRRVQLSPPAWSQVWRPDSCLHPHYQAANQGRALSPPTNGSLRWWEIFLAPLTAFIMHTMVVMVRPSDGISIVSWVQAESGSVRQMFAPTVCWVMWVFAS